MADKYRARENARATAFTKATHELSAIENKMRAKVIDMQKREAQIETLENTLGSKIEESVKNIAAKDAEVFAVRKELQAMKVQHERDNSETKDKLLMKENEIERLTEEIRNLKRDAEDTSIAKLRLEIEKRDGTIIEREHKIEKLIKQKEEWKATAENWRMKAGAIKNQMDTIRENTLREREEESKR